MGTTKAMDNERRMIEIPVQYNTEQAQEDTTDIVPAQAQVSTEEEQQLTTVVHRKRQAVPIQKKVLLTLEEAAEYTGIGLHKLREISNDESCPFVLFNGNKRMLKRKKLNKYLADSYSI